MADNDKAPCSAPGGEMPDHARQILNAYNDNHQITAFLQDMLVSVFQHLPVDPYEFMLEYLARHKPARPPPYSSLWVRRRAGEVSGDWQLCRCWVSRDGVLCITDPVGGAGSSPPARDAAAAPPQEAAAPGTAPPPPEATSVRIKDDADVRPLSEDDGGKPFAFRVAGIDLAALTEGQREMWLKVVRSAVAQRETAAAA
mmetsp:Transcript_99435/g.309808  ORF Transcript_99435/g.309808 Transcript_99435/m.309808 type:complete len:199 (+) Transcript_99435:81-677(+)|eukprot:CAMPEP_0204564832 /NCGR_PEP_ID=MMETSP0661-20131031/35123_1 /ASSEMBLY_ACC=CAM_ASM_000606 /TAXON_ID=109239 /ORGANISM="Alexandrium margalefi, Strain AMGDE01CS-322" /LENGTH=198 /DNA_ID=CAMNT_0051572523 /DNA_START=80 /DNA_END=676 /DNA_ORIENTATION=-